MYANAPTDHNLWRRARQYMRGSASDVAVMLVRLARTKKVTRHVSCYAELLRVGSRALMTGDQGVEQTGNRKQTERRSVEDSRKTPSGLEETENAVEAGPEGGHGGGDKLGNRPQTGAAVTKKKSKITLLFSTKFLLIQTPPLQADDTHVTPRAHSTAPIIAHHQSHGPLAGTAPSSTEIR